MVERAVLHDERRHGRAALLLQDDVVADAEAHLHDEIDARLGEQLGLRDRVADRGEALGVRFFEPDLV